VFPALERPHFTSSFVLRLLAFLGILVSVVCVLINIAISTRVWWSIFVVAGTCCFWCAAAIGVLYRRDLTQNIGWQIVLISVLSILWDWGTGGHGWSLDFVFPCVCVIGLSAICLASLLLRISVRTFIGPYLAACLLGLLPIGFMLLGKVRVVIPSLVCAGISIVMIALLTIFQWQTVKSEFLRRFHL